jgi:hypothetical protein
MTTCIGCGCTDDEACPGGCYWVAISPSERAGACSECVLSGLIPQRGSELLQELGEAEAEWTADQVSIRNDYDLDRDRLILPGHPEFAGTLRARR